VLVPPKGGERFHIDSFMTSQEGGRERDVRSSISFRCKGGGLQFVLSMGSEGRLLESDWEGQYQALRGGKKVDVMEGDQHHSQKGARLDGEAPGKFPLKPGFSEGESTYSLSALEKKKDTPGERRRQRVGNRSLSNSGRSSNKGGKPATNHIVQSMRCMREEEEEA